jgi:hypothetical protein
METMMTENLRLREEVDSLKSSAERSSAEIAELTRRNQSMRGIYENRTTQYNRVVSLFDKFLTDLVGEEAIDETSEAYIQHARELVEDGTLTDPFLEESEHRIEVVITYQYDVNVKHPRSMTKEQVKDLIIDAFGEADGIRDNVNDDLGDNCEIQDVSQWSHDVEVNKC